MFKIFNRFSLTFLLLTFLAFSCKKKDDPVNPNNTTATYGEIGFEFSNYAGSAPLVMNSDSYVTATGDSITVSKFNYYISNIRVKKSDGGEYVEPDSYHLVQSGVLSSKHFHLENVPTGTYTSVSFLIGVDSARNESGAQTGALDPVNGMFWTWSTGYIMAKLEGTSPQSTSPGKTYTFHIGGYKGSLTGVRQVTLNFPNNMQLVSNSEGTIDVKADVLKWFSPNNISIASNPEIMSVTTASNTIANNYANMFSITNVLVTAQ